MNCRAFMETKLFPKFNTTKMLLREEHCGFLELHGSQQDNRLEK